MAESVCSDNNQVEHEHDLAGKLAAISVDDEDVAKFRCLDYYFSLTVELTKIPYLEILAHSKDFMEKPDSNGVIILSESSCDPELLKVVIKYIRTDRPLCLFTGLPDNSNPSKLFDLLDYLCVEKPKCSLAELNTELKNVASDRSLARDACVKLCWFGRELVGPKEQSKLYNMILFIVSHPRTFYLRLRRVTFNWYMQYFQITEKQRNILQCWLDKCESFSEEDNSSSGGSHDEDEPYFTDSDYSD